MRRLRTIAAMCAAAALVAATGAVAQNACPIYTTGFDAFSGPPDYAQGPFKVQWCLNGASVTASNFCPTGNALKLDSTTDDPVVLVHVGDVGCASVSLTFTYAQFAATGTTLKAGLTNATTVSCSPSTPTTLGTLSTTGGVCTQVTLTALVTGSQGVFFRFDHGNTGATAITIDDLTISVVGCCDETHPCCETGYAGCADDSIAACVCAIDQFCCQTQWDAQCVAEVDSFACGACSGGGPPACSTSFAVDFGTAYSTTSVCQLFPEFFEGCEGSPPTLTISGLCASSGDPAMRFGTGFPYSAAITRCFDLGAMPAPTLSFRWSRNSGSLGPRVDYRIADGRWLIAWQPSTGQGTTACTQTTLDLAPLAGLGEVRFKFVSGSSVSSGATIDDIVLDPGQPPHDCCTSGGTGCTDSIVESCVCAADAYCCNQAWDDQCIAYATFACGSACPGVPTCGEPNAGSCVVAHLTSFCSDAACCGVVCSFDPFCCLSVWDDLCASEASAVCAVPIVGDLDGDGIVNGADLATLLAAWGASGGPLPSDLDGNGTVDGADLAVLLAAWTTA